MNRAYYASKTADFLNETNSSIIGKLVTSHPFDLDDLQRNAWIEQIVILKNVISDLGADAYLCIEYAIPRMGKRVDAILIIAGVVIVLEFKIGERVYPQHAIDQVLDYALDLKNFHRESHHGHVVPVLVSTVAPSRPNAIRSYEDLVYEPICTNKDQLSSVVRYIIEHVKTPPIDPIRWQDSVYEPTPTIIEAAQALYKGHSVTEISRSDSGAINLSKTNAAIADIIEDVKLNKQKAIVFVTGVPGAGKTLAGLNIANERHNVDSGEHAVFLSGNGPLVSVLQEALARGEVHNSLSRNQRPAKQKALSKTKAFIQMIHHFRDDALATQTPPIERVVIFDEAQRAWTLEQTRDFMKRKKGIQGFDRSEPDFLISVLDRHEGYAVIICLIGGGQEINTGEAGLGEWFRAIEAIYQHWNVYVSEKLEEIEYTGGEGLFETLFSKKLHRKYDLHLAVSVRSFRSETVSELVKQIIDGDYNAARKHWPTVSRRYPIRVTRSLESAKAWLRKQARGTERYGLLASSGAYRLRPYGIHVKAKIDPRHWFLNGKDDVRSSYALEEVATEFDIQGLELDWTCVCWDADFSFNGNEWECRKFRGTQWQNVNDLNRRQYLRNAYRVLLTRARQGMVLFIPPGSETDSTRPSEWYDHTFHLIRSIGIPQL